MIRQDITYMYKSGYTAEKTQSLINNAHIAHILKQQASSLLAITQTHLEIQPENLIV